MKRSVSVFLGALLAAIAAYTVSGALRGLKGEPGVPAAVLSQPWVAQSLAGGDFTFESPWALSPRPVDFPPEVRAVIREMVSVGHDAQGLNVTAMYLAAKPGMPTSLEGGADGAIANLRTIPGTASIDARKIPGKVSGHDAIEIDVTITRKAGRPLRLHGLVVSRGSETFQVLIIHRLDQSVGDQAWQRLKGSLKLSAGKGA